MKEEVLRNTWQLNNYSDSLKWKCHNNFSNFLWFFASINYFKNCNSKNRLPCLWMSCDPIKLLLVAFDIHFLIWVYLVSSCYVWCKQVGKYNLKQYWPKTSLMCMLSVSLFYARKWWISLCIWWWLNFLSSIFCYKFFNVKSMIA